MSTGTMEERPRVLVMPFGVEADHPRNCDLMLQCVPGLRLRSAIDGTKHTIDVKSGMPMVPIDQSKAFASFPKTPGMQIHVNPAELTYSVIDPLHGDKEMCDRLRMYFRNTTGALSGDRLEGVPPRSGSLDLHRMKSLVREMLWLVQAKEAKRCKGAMPTL